MVKEKKSRSKSATTKRDPSPLPPPSSSSGSSSDSSDVSDSESDYSTTDTEEDDDGAQLTPAMDAAILRTLAKIKKGGEELYAGQNLLQSELELARQAAEARGLKSKAKAAEEQPFLLKDLHQRNLLEGGVPESDDEDEDQPMTFVQETRKARDDAVNAFKAFAGSDSEDEAEDLLVKRERAPEEAEEDDEAYRKFLLEMGGGEEEVRKALGLGQAPVSLHREYSDDEDDFRAEAGGEEEDEKKKKKKEKKKSKKDKLSAEEKAEKRSKADDEFLMDYILNRGWIEKSDKKRVPTYEEIVGHERPEGDSDADADDEDAPWGALDEDAEFEDRAEEFETQYNFRFEEPGAAEIVTHPRQIESLARRDDDKRKLKREARAERKAAEKAKREEETKRQKGEKRREMEKQLAALKEELGGADVDWSAVEKVLEGEYDEAEWDRVVGEMLEKAAGASDDEKPAWDDDDEGDYPMEEDDGYIEPQAWEETEEWAAGAEEDEDEGPINMDADFLDSEPVKPKKLSKAEKKKAKLAAKEAAAAAAEDGDEKLSVAERAAKVKAAAESLRSLDHEDQIGDLKTRFKYVKSSSSSFGLTPAEILLATDAELNELVSVKALAPYRRGGLGRAGYGLGRRVRDLKAKLRDRQWGEEVEEPSKKQKKAHVGGGGSNAIPLGPKKGDGEGRPGKRLGRKERMKLKAAGEEGEEAPASGVGEKRKRTESVSAAVPETAEAVAEGGEGDGEKKKKRRKKKKAAAVEA